MKLSEMSREDRSKWLWDRVSTGVERMLLDYILDLEQDRDALKKDRDNWRSAAVSHIACVEHTKSHVMEFVPCPYCVSEKLAKELDLIEKREGSK